MKGIAMFINACLAYSTVEFFNASIYELVHQLAIKNYDVSIALIPPIFLAFLIGSIAFLNIYKLVKGE